MRAHHRNSLGWLGGLALLVGLATGCSSTPRIIPGMVWVEPGTFTMGYDEGAPNEKPARQVVVSRGYYIDIYEVTNQQYYNFCQQAKHPAPPHWKDGKFPEGQELYPVVNVSLEDARAYARFYGKRLPTEIEWEYAARGPDGRLYPWGNTWDPEAAHTFESGKQGPVAVNTMPKGRGPFGTYHQAGNVWEWTETEAQPGLFVIKGGSFAPLEDRPRASLRGLAKATVKRDNLGFRCVKDPE
ncbi:MAG: hypothetical protein KatS3mg102_2065 [Planctomycetota bacterium]|nr:MAG: hypothetical protein KatS3mg102_2065 [Planctomycetota bacterium]